MAEMCMKTKEIWIQGICNNQYYVVLTAGKAHPLPSMNIPQADLRPSLSPECERSSSGGT